MFGFMKNRGTAAQEAARPGLFQRLKQRLGRTRGSLTEGLARLVLGKKAIDDEILEEIETRLLMADVGADATARIIADLTARVQRRQLDDAEALLAALKEDMHAILAPCSVPLAIPPDQRPYVILMVGVNGVGKTTTIGKLAKYLQAEGHSVMLAAGDTFRAAAVEQLQTWGERNDVAVIAQARAPSPPATHRRRPRPDQPRVPARSQRRRCARPRSATAPLPRRGRCRRPRASPRTPPPANISRACRCLWSCPRRSRPPSRSHRASVPGGCRAARFRARGCRVCLP